MALAVPTMPSSAIQQRIPRFWRIAFWLVCIHFILYGIIALFQFQQNWHAEMLQIFPWRSTGIFKAVSLWLFENSAGLACLWVASDLMALYLIWHLARHRRNPRPLPAYLIFMTATLALHLAAIAHLEILQVVPTPTMTFIVDRTIAILFATNDLIFSFPVWVIFIGLVFIKRRPRTGLCPTCGYDLRASKEKCPECGTPVASSPIFLEAESRGRKASEENVRRVRVS